VDKLATGPGWRCAAIIRTAWEPPEAAQPVTRNNSYQLCKNHSFSDVPGRRTAPDTAAAGGGVSGRASLVGPPRGER